MTHSDPATRLHQLAVAILEALDEGIVVCDPALDHLRYANAAAARALAALGAVPEHLPDRLREPVRGAAAEGELPVGCFTRAVEVAGPSGARFFVRARRLRAPGGGVLLVITPMRLRRADLVVLLQVRLGLTARQSECVALVRQGLRNREVAERLGLTEVTVSGYLVATHKRLGVTTRAALLALVHDTVGGGVAQRRAPPQRRTTTKDR